MKLIMEVVATAMVRCGGGPKAGAPPQKSKHRGKQKQQQRQIGVSPSGRPLQMPHVTPVEVRAGAARDTRGLAIVPECKAFISRTHPE